MNPLSATTVGFRLLFRRPLIPFAEIAWRWTFAAGAWVLGIAFLFNYFDSLTVTKLDQFLLSTGQPFLIAQAVRRIFHGSSVRVMEAGIVLGLGLAIAWLILASLGRLAVLRSVFEELEFSARSERPFQAVLFLNFLRAALVLATKLAGIGSILMTSGVWASSHLRIVDAVRFEVLIWFLIWLTWALLNWLLSAASIFVMAEGRDSLAAIASVLRLLQSRSAGTLGASAAFGAVHLAAFFATAGTILVLLPLAVARPVTLPLAFVVILGYCFIADLLYTGKLAAYAYLATGSDELPSWMRATLLPPTTSTSVDKGELILSDVPSPA